MWSSRRIKTQIQLPKLVQLILFTAACIYKKTYLAARPASAGGPTTTAKELSAEDNAKLVFGTVFSLRNMVRKLGGEEDSFVSYRTSHYKLHFYETPTNLKFVIVTDTKMNNLRIVLHQIYVSLYVEYVVKNPLSPIEHTNGQGVDCELFEAGLDQFFVSHHMHGSLSTSRTDLFQEYNGSAPSHMILWSCGLASLASRFGLWVSVHCTSSTGCRIPAQ